MIPRAGPKVEQLPALKLYREDIEKLFSLWKANCQQVLVGDDEHLYESLTEMEENAPPRLQCFILQGFVPHAELVIRGSRAAPLATQRSMLWIAGRDQKSELLFFSAKDILHNRKWVSMIALRIAALTVSAVLFFALLFSKSILRAHHIGSDFTYDLAAFIGLAFFLLGGWMTTKQVSYTTLRLRSKSQSFWERHRDDFVKQAITSAIAGLIGYIIGHFLK
jgi:hypothetical protein